VQIVPEPIREKNLYDDTDRHLMAALQSVEVPVDLRARLERSLETALHEQGPQAPSRDQSSNSARTDSPIWNRRSAIAAAVAAGVGGLAFGFRQIWQPLTQGQLVTLTQQLLNGIDGATWQDLTEVDAVAVKQSLQDVGFLRQVRNVALVRFSQLQPPSNIQRAKAYKFNEEFVLLDLVIERGVQQLSASLTELPWGRSDTVAFAMSSAPRTLVFVGPASLRDHILPAQTI